jgi:hypothetical protein
MVDNLAMKSYLEVNKPQFFTLDPNSEKPIKAVIRHLPLETPAEDISNSLEGFGFFIGLWQLTTNRRALNGQTHLEARNVKSQEIFKLNILNHIIITVES